MFSAVVCLTIVIFWQRPCPNKLLIFSDEPTKPGTPKVVDYDNESVKLKWDKPDSDGGATIEKYIIEKKDK